MQLPDDLRDQLKHPLGNLVSDNDPNKENIIKKITAESIIITVGDRTTENMLQLGHQTPDSNHRRSRKT